MESVLGKISTASTATTRPSKVTRQAEAMRSSSMTRGFSRDLEDVTWTSYFMASGPVVRGALPASSGKAGLGRKRTDKHAGPTGLLARWPRRWRRHRRLGRRPEFRRQEKCWSADGAAIRPATWCAPHHGENRVHPKCVGK